MVPDASERAANGKVSGLLTSRPGAGCTLKRDGWMLVRVRNTDSFRVCSFLFPLRVTRVRDAAQPVAGSRRRGGD